MAEDFQDGLRNLVANLGTSRDKSAGGAYVPNALTDSDLTNAYRTSAIARAVVDSLPDDATREWREWQADGDEVAAIEAEERRLGVRRVVNDALKRARLFGGAAIYIGTGDDAPSEPLDPDKLTPGGLRYLTVLDRQEMSAEQLQLDPSQPGYNRPTAYRVYGAGKKHVEIHPTRLVLFNGAQLPTNNLVQSQHGWGDSVLQSILEPVKRLDATYANIGSLIYEAKVDVIRIKDFTQGLRAGGAEYENRMLKRFALANTAKGINGALLLDAEEEYEQKSANFSTLPEIADRMAQMVSAASGIPVTRLFGLSPGGMNATGESDMRNYYDRVKQIQSNKIEPEMEVLDACLVQSALGCKPEQIIYQWRSLWQLDQVKRAEVADKLTTAFERVYRMDEIVPGEAIAESLARSMGELGFPFGA